MHLTTWLSKTGGIEAPSHRSMDGGDEGVDISVCSYLYPLNLAGAGAAREVWSQRPLCVINIVPDVLGTTIANLD